MYLPSYAIGHPIRMENTKNSTILFAGLDENYMCELVPGDKIFMINCLGYTTEDIFISANIDKKMLEVEHNKEIDLTSLVFIGVMDNY